MATMKKDKRFPTMKRPPVPKIQKTPTLAKLAGSRGMRPGMARSK